MYPHNRVEYYIGRQFGDLIYLGDATSVNGRRMSNFKCYCGTEFNCQLFKVKSGKTKSCGCLQRKATGDANRIHGLKNHELYGVWSGMKARCYNIKTKQYNNYGGKGVIVYREWADNFMVFYNWAIVNGWKQGLQLDKDIKGTGLLYSPEMCCFVTPKENSNKRGSSRYITYNNETKTVSQWAEYFNLSLKNLYQRLSRGWSVEECFNQKS